MIFISPARNVKDRFMKEFLIIVLGSIMASGAAANSNSTKICTESYFQKKYESAIAACKDVPEKDKGLGFLILGQTYHEMGRFHDAFDAYIKSDELGDYRAAHALGVMYQSGEYVQTNLTKAVEYFIKGANSGDQRSAYNLGYIYQLGISPFETDYEKALKWYKQSNDAPSKNNLAYMYENGQGVDKNIPLSIELYRASANEGYLPAMFNLGKILMSNFPSDPEMLDEAEKWFKLAASKNLSQAYIKLEELKKLRVDRY